MHGRTALVGTLAVVAALMTGLVATAVAQEDTSALADHPLTGTWMAMANPPLPDDPQFAAPSYFGADGSVLLIFPSTQVGPQGVQHVSDYVGTWEADGERRGHFTAVQVLSDADGAFLGTITVDGYPMVSDDGQTFIDDGSLVMVTIRDAAGVIVDQFPGAGGRPVTAIRMGPGSPGFPETSGATASPSPSS
jgi:hypothetical protein